MLRKGASSLRNCSRATSLRLLTRATADSLPMLINNEHPFLSCQAMRMFGMYFAVPVAVLKLVQVVFDAVFMPERLLSNMCHSLPMQVKIESDSTAECLAACNQICQSSCSPTISSSQCSHTCDATCAEHCPVESASAQSPTTSQTAPPTIPPLPLKINIQLAPDNPPHELWNQSAVPPSEPPPTNCLQQCSEGCQQSCSERTPPPAEGCGASCINTCNYICASSKPSQMTVKDVSTYPVRLDPQQRTLRCSSECQSVCQLACKSLGSRSSCIDTCAPHCDQACSSPQVQRNSAYLFSRNKTSTMSDTHSLEVPSPDPTKPAFQPTTTTVPVRIEIIWENQPTATAMPP
ncbi:hypothetical protein COOONC_06652 [Cooperia oncophora]